MEAVAEKWLMPRLATFKAAHPGVAIELETTTAGRPGPGRLRRLAGLQRRDGGAGPVTRREDTLLEETLYEEDLMPVCSPALLAARGRPLEPADLQAWPLLYDLGWDADWAYWFGRQGESTPDLWGPRASASTACWSRPRCTGSAPPSGRPMLIAAGGWKPEGCCRSSTARRRRRSVAASSPRRPPGSGRSAGLPEWMLEEARAAAGARRPGPAAVVTRCRTGGKRAGHDGRRAGPVPRTG